MVYLSEGKRRMAKKVGSLHTQDCGAIETHGFHCLHNYYSATKGNKLIHPENSRLNEISLIHNVKHYLILKLYNKQIHRDTKVTGH